MPEMHIPSKRMQSVLSLTKTRTPESVGVFQKKTIELLAERVPKPSSALQRELLNNLKYHF